jgi:hypothetical protein
MKTRQKRTRKIDVVLNRLQFGKFPTRDWENRFLDLGDGKCRWCDQRETLQHIFEECRGLVRLRSELARKMKLPKIHWREIFDTKHRENHIYIYHFIQNAGLLE